MNKLLSILSFIFFLVACDSGLPSQNASSQLEIFAEIPSAPGNIAYDREGNLVFSNHPFFTPDIRVMRYDVKAKTVAPFPNLDWNTKKAGNSNYLSVVLGVRNDSKGIVWMLDMGFRDSIIPKLVGWNTNTNTLERIYYIPSPASIPTSQLNDFAFDEKHEVFFLADEDIANGGDASRAALVVVNTKTNQSYRRLEGHYSTLPEKEKPIVIAGRTLYIPGTQRPLLVGADGIALDKNNEWLYYAPLNGSKVYRIRTEDLLNTSLSNDVLETRVETFADKENNGGISIDVDGNLYLTYVEKNGVGLIRADRSATLFSNDRLIWPDGVSYNGVDGYMYVPDPQLPLGAAFNGGIDRTTRPFRIFRFKPLAQGLVGR